MDNASEEQGMEQGSKKQVYITDTILRRVLDADHSELEEHIRFQEASIYNTRASILDEYRVPGGFTLGKCRDHLHFLYLTHQLCRSDDELKDMAIVDHDLRLAKPHIGDIYLPGIAAYSPEELFLPAQGPSFAASFIHPAFLEDPPAQPEPTHPTWTSWLCNVLGVRSQIRLLSKSGESLAESFLYVAEHRKDKFLGALEQVWRTQGALLADRPALNQMIRQISIPCTSGVVRRLWETYLPLEKLRGYCGLFLENNEPFPFLELGEPISTVESMEKWSFLHTDFGVSVNDDVGFLLDVLAHTKEANPQGLSTSRCKNLMRLYHDIEARCLQSADPASVREIVWTFVADINGIAIPESPVARARWVGPLECLWDAPLGMVTKTPIQAVYGTVLKCPPAEMAALSSFFRETMSIPTMAWSDLTAELAALRDDDSHDEAHIRRIYEQIQSLATSDIAGELRYSGFPEDRRRRGACQLTGT